SRDWSSDVCSSDLDHIDRLCKVWRHKMLRAKAIANELGGGHIFNSKSCPGFLSIWVLFFIEFPSLRVYRMNDLCKKPLFSCLHPGYPGSLFPPIPSGHFCWSDWLFPSASPLL